jgi:hypothetical protein
MRLVRSRPRAGGDPLRAVPVPALEEKLRVIERRGRIRAQRCASDARSSSGKSAPRRCTVATTPHEWPWPPTGANQHTRAEAREPRRRSSGSHAVAPLLSLHPAARPGRTACRGLRCDRLSHERRVAGGADDEGRVQWAITTAFGDERRAAGRHCGCAAIEENLPRRDARAFPDPRP